MSSVLEPQGPSSTALPFSFHYLIGEIASVSAVLGAFAKILPDVATFMAIAWYAIMIFEWRANRRAARDRERIQLAAHTAAQVVLDEAAKVKGDLAAVAKGIVAAEVEKVIPVLADAGPDLPHHQGE